MSSNASIHFIGETFQVIAVILHYSIMATWAWMFVEAYYMYIALISIMPKYYSHMVLKMSLFGWGEVLL